MSIYGVSENGFTLKRLYNIIDDIDTRLATIQDPVTGETLNLDDENDPINQIKNAFADELSACWEQLEMVHNQLNPRSATGQGLSSLVQLNGLVKKIGESDTTLRGRQQKQTAKTATSLIESLYASVGDLPGVTFARAYQNSTLSDPDSRGIPAKSVSVVVVGGDDQEIADTIFTKVSASTGLYGNVTKICIDSLGSTYDVSFMRPTEVPVTIEINIKVIDTGKWPSDGAQKIKDALVAFAAYTSNPGLPPGADIIESRLYTPINTIPGHEILSVKLSRDGGGLLSQNIPISWNEVAAISAGNITVNLL